MIKLNFNMPLIITVSAPCNVTYSYSEYDAATNTLQNSASNTVNVKNSAQLVPSPAVGFYRNVTGAAVTNLNPFDVDVVLYEGTTYTRTDVRAGETRDLTGELYPKITAAGLTTLRNSYLLTPSLAPPIGTHYVVADGTMTNAVVYWTGESFHPIDGVVISKAALPPATIATRTSNNSTDTTTTPLETVVIPGFLMGKNSTLKIEPTWGSDNVNANSRNLIVQFNNTAGGAQSIAAPTVTGTAIQASHLVKLKNCNSYTAQFVFNNQSYTTSSGVLLTNNKDTLADTEIRFACSWTANQTPTTATISLNGYEITII